MRELATRTNSSASTINGLEKGKTRLDLRWLRIFSKVFGVPPSEIADLDGEHPIGFEDDAELYDPGLLPSRLRLAEAQFVYEAKTSALDQIGIHTGMKLIADASPEAISGLSSGEPVIVQAYDGMRATTLLRQFIAPSLLITNSERQNSRIINMRTEDAVIKAVVVSVYSDFKQAQRPDIKG